jgi:hypothetical protein
MRDAANRRDVPKPDSKQLIRSDHHTERQNGHRARPQDRSWIAAALTSPSEADRYDTRITGGGSHEPRPGGKIAGALSFGQYMRIVRMKSPLGAGSQFASLSLPGDSFWKYRVNEPSALNVGLSRKLTVNLFSGLG